MDVTYGIVIFLVSVVKRAKVFKGTAHGVGEMFVTHE